VITDEDIATGSPEELKAVLSALEHERMLVTYQMALIRGLIEHGPGYLQRATRAAHRSATCRRRR
jgi:hypothetical protein